jgi:hypothetical protein
MQLLHKKLRYLELLLSVAQIIRSSDHIPDVCLSIRSISTHTVIHIHVECDHMIRAQYLLRGHSWFVVGGSGFGVETSKFKISAGSAAPNVNLQ